MEWTHELLYRAQRTKLRLLAAPWFATISTSQMFLSPRKDTTPQILPSQKTHLDHPKPGGYRPGDRVGMRLSKLAFSPSCFPWNCIRHTAIFNEHKVLFFTQKLLYCIRAEGFLGTRVTVGIRSNILSWTYHVFNKLKVVIMSDGYRRLRAFLFEPAK